MVTKVQQPMLSLTPQREIKVGTDTTHAPYDFAELADALVEASKYTNGVDNNGQRPIRITIPAGTHEFTKTINLRGANMMHVQIWCDYAAVVRCPLSTDRVFFDAVGCYIGDIVGFKTMKPPTGSTVATDPATVCVGTDGNYMSWFRFNQCVIGRMQGIGFDGDTSGVRDAICIAAQSTQILYADDITFKNVKECGSFYLGSTINGAEITGVTGTDIYSGFRVHDSIVGLRKVNLTGFIHTGNDGYADGVCMDVVRGTVTTQSGHWQGFNNKFVVSNATIGDRCSSTYITELYKRVTDGSTISTIERYLSKEVVVSQNTINTIYNTTVMRTGQFEYTGDGNASKVVTPTDASNIRSVSIRKLDDFGSVTCVRGNTAMVGTAQAIFIGEDNKVTVYGTVMNTLNTKYLLTYE